MPAASIAPVPEHRTIPAAARQMRDLRDVGALFYRRGWSLATSSNYSVVLSRDPLRLLITASGRDKGRLGRHDFVIVDETGQPVTPGAPRPSAETLLHVAAVEQPGIGAVLHTHSVWATLLSARHARAGYLELSGYEMLKGLAGIHSHEERVRVAIFDNTQDIPALARVVRARLADPVQPLRHGFLLAGHGLYAWGRDLDEARRHIEAFEFLFEVAGRSLGLAGQLPHEE